jgi:multidrug efflux pump subunit AcrA (membrane-fusion protein)
VEFDISDADFNAIQQNAKKVSQADNLSISPEGQGFSGKFSIAIMRGPDASADGGFDYEGTLLLTDNTLDASTGTILLRGEIPNPDYRIFPEQICRVRIPAELIPNAVLVREEALNSDLNTKFLLVVDKDYTVRRRNVKIGELVNNRMRVILAGLRPGETYIYQGLQRARIDEKVVPLTQEEYDKKYDFLINGNGNGKKVEVVEETTEEEAL